MKNDTVFVDVILPLAVPKLYTYSVPEELVPQVAIGKRVVVQFGKKKMYTALVKIIHHKVPSYETKEIFSVLDPMAIVLEQQFKLWEWMSSYYLCSVGEVMSAALPSGLKLESETRILLNQEINSESIITLKSRLTEKEFQILDALHLKNVLTLTEISSITKRKNVFPFIRSMIDKGLIYVDENLIQRFKPKVEVFVKLSPKSEDEKWMKDVFTKLEKRAPVQLELLMTFLKFSMDASDFNHEILKTRLIALSDKYSAALSQLVKKEILILVEREGERIPTSVEQVKGAITYNEFQEKAIKEIDKNLKEKDVVLLHGVTSSGKTEIYIHFIEKALAEGKQVLYLLPEIALTTQIIRRLQKHFGDKIGVYHSRFNDNQRVEIWKRVLSSNENDPHSQSPSCRIILGARSAIFLPFENLGLVIVDEEHENSFKQYDPAPRYNARDTAIFLAGLQGAKTILGSATPSLETYFNAKENKYGMVTIEERFGGIQMPEIAIVNMADETKKKKMKGHFSSVLLDGIELALKQKEQVILFQNRRGYAPYIECPTCGWNPHCENCDVTLVYHKQSEQMRCHYCGFHHDPPKVCGACGDPALKMLGFGTEKIEDDLSIFFPKARIARLDMDTARSKNSFQQLIQDFEKQDIDILVGTQMVTKGLDFDNVSTVGIMNADAMLRFPDFRASERSFQLMAQVSGRSGRKKKRGKVIIQAYHPEHTVIGHVLKNDYKNFYSEELNERMSFAYPPFFRLIEITIKHRDIRELSRAADEFASDLLTAIGKGVLGPELPPVARIRNLYLKNILIKIGKDQSLTRVKQTLISLLEEFKSREENRNVLILIDVDPQ